MKTAEIRNLYLKFFEERGHTVHPSASLIPDDDPSLLFTGAGMNQFKDMFLGRGNLPFQRATTSQKCLRVPDLEDVGRTPSHHTFFEMLGNFSFGDYFKEEAIAWADELLREGFGLSRGRLFVSVYKDDDEAYALWQKIGYPRDRIFRYGEDENFWPAEAPSKGPNGPCGPCSEIYYDFGEEVGGARDLAENGRRFVEIWNLVFTQFARRDGGVLEPLPQRNIDTGMGLERVARVLQRGQTNFDTDAFEPLIRCLCELAQRPYGEDPAVDRAMRRIADHIRAVVFCIADGVVPSNERQGYVVRKILRRAVADGLDTLGLGDPFLATVAKSVFQVEGLVDIYPELGRLSGKICQVVGEEEEKFRSAYERGRETLAREIDKLRKSGVRTLPGSVAFFLWDTAGFPLDLTRRVLADEKLELDEKGFEQAMEKQREKSRAASNIQAEIFPQGPMNELKAQLKTTEFHGYEVDEETAVLRAIIQNETLVEQAAEGDDVSLVFEHSPFYAEGGGQVGDRGRFVTSSAQVRIFNTLRKDGYHVHQARVVSGTVAVGDSGTLAVDRQRHRGPTMRNHTATHLVHWALRKVLGDNVDQRGSLVDASRLRFDFSYPTAVPRAQLQEVEKLVNKQILKNLEVSKSEQTFAEAMDAGAIALFGEKYGDRVRVVKVEDEIPDHQSVELCGGTHVARTGDIGSFRVVSESGIAAGVRRIEALTGVGAIEFDQRRDMLLEDLAANLKTSPEGVADRVTALQEEIRRLKKDLQKAAQAPHAAAGALEQVLAGAKEVNSVKTYVQALEHGGQDLARLLDAMKDRHKEPFCSALLGKENDRVPIVVGANKGAQAKGIHAGEICRALSNVLGGGGGGNPAFARGQGKDPARIDAAIAAARAEIERMLSS